MYNISMKFGGDSRQQLILHLISLLFLLVEIGGIIWNYYYSLQLKREAKGNIELAFAIDHATSARFVLITSACFVTLCINIIVSRYLRATR